MGARGGGEWMDIGFVAMGGGGDGFLLLIMRGGGGGGDADW